MAVWFISIGRMPFLAPTLDNVDITQGFYLRHLEVADQNAAGGGL